MIRWGLNLTCRIISLGLHSNSILLVVLYLHFEVRNESIYQGRSEPTCNEQSSRNHHLLFGLTLSNALIDIIYNSLKSSERERK